MGNVGNAISQKTSARKIATAKRRGFIIQARLAGYPFTKIVEEVKKWAKKEGIELPKDYDERQACQDILRELQKLRDNNQTLAAEYRDLELERLDYLQVALWKAALDGNEKKTDRILKIMEHRAKYLGLFAPEKKEITGKDGDPVQVIFELPDNGRRAKKEED